MAKSGKSFSLSVNLLLYTLIVAIFLFGFLIVQAMAQEDSEISGQVTGNSKGECIPGGSILVLEVGIHQPTGRDDTHAGSGYNISVPGGTATDDEYSHASPESIVANIGPNYHESKLPQASPITDEFGLGYQQDFHHEYNEGSTSHIEYRHIIHYVDREVVKEVLVEKPVELRQFTSIEELEAWLAEDDTNEYVYLFAGKDGVCQPSDRYDCDDYAFQLQQRAVNSGFLISVTIIQKQGKPHMINLACIGNSIYYIEPQSDKVWFYCNRD